MNNQELYRLIKDSKLAQVAKPLSKKLRGNQSAPTHQIIYTPKSSAIRSNFGIKTALPKQIGFSHIVFNDIDNAQNMPDVEKYSGGFFNRIKFQEMNVAVRAESNHNPLFKSESSKTPTNAKENDRFNDDSVATALNLKSNTPTEKVKKLLQKNPDLYKKFHEFITKNYPDKLVSNISKADSRLVNEFLQSTTNIKKAKMSLFKHTSRSIQGTGGFSYLQKGRLSNTPNGVKYGTIAPGRILDTRDGAIGGFVATVTDHTSLQRNYTKNFPGKHQRQFVVPFKINDVEVSSTGKVRMEANGVKSGSDRFNEANNQYSTSGVRRTSERMANDMKQFSALLSVLEDPSK